MFENNDSLENCRNLNFTVFNHQFTKEYGIKASLEQTHYTCVVYANGGLLEIEAVSTSRQFTLKYKNKFKNSISLCRVSVTKVNPMWHPLFESMSGSKLVNRLGERTLERRQVNFIANAP